MGCTPVVDGHVDERLGSDDFLRGVSDLLTVEPALCASDQLLPHP